MATNDELRIKKQGNFRCVLVSTPRGGTWQKLKYPIELNTSCYCCVVVF